MDEHNNIDALAEMVAWDLVNVLFLQCIPSQTGSISDQFPLIRQYLITGPMCVVPGIQE